jgi:hypothetical protein
MTSELGSIPAVANVEPSHRIDEGSSDGHPASSSGSFYSNLKPARRASQASYSRSWCSTPESLYRREPRLETTPNGISDTEASAAPPLILEPSQGEPNYGSELRRVGTPPPFGFGESLPASDFQRAAIAGGKYNEQDRYMLQGGSPASTNVREHPATSDDNNSNANKPTHVEGSYFPLVTSFPPDQPEQSSHTQKNPGFVRYSPISASSDPATSPYPGAGMTPSARNLFEPPSFQPDDRALTRFPPSHQQSHLPGTQAGHTNPHTGEPESHYHATPFTPPHSTRQVQVERTRPAPIRIVDVDVDAITPVDPPRPAPVDPPRAVQELTCTPVRSRSQREMNRSPPAPGTQAGLWARFVRKLLCAKK